MRDVFPLLTDADIDRLRQVSRGDVQLAREMDVMRWDHLIKGRFVFVYRAGSKWFVAATTKAHWFLGPATGVPYDGDA